MGGTRPHALSWDRQIVAEAICQVDSQIVAWPAVQGHRLRHTHRLRKNNRCDTFANIIFQLKMHNDPYDKNNHNKRRNGYANRQTERSDKYYNDHLKMHIIRRLQMIETWAEIKGIESAVFEALQREDDLEKIEKAQFETWKKEQEAKNG